MLSIPIQRKRGSMTEEQKAFQQIKNENDFKNEIVLRFQKLESFFQSMQNDLDNICALHQQNQVDSIHATHEISNNCMQSLRDVRLLIGEVQKQIKILSDESSLKFYDIKSSYIERKDYSYDYNSLIAKNESLQRESVNYRNEFLALLAKQYHDFETKLADFMQKQALKPDPIPELKHLFDEKLDLVSLNGQNSVLRSTNNEKHIHLIEKKIENIYQLIKQIQLDKQA